MLENLHKDWAITDSPRKPVVSVIVDEHARILEIFAEINADQPTVLVHDVDNPIEVELALLDADLTIEQTLKKYTGQISPDALQNLGEILSEKMRARILEVVQERKTK